MTKSEFAVLIEDGSDIMFDVAGKHFTILTWMDEGIGIGEQHKPDVPIQHFSDAEDLLDNFEIDGIPFGDLANEIVITEYS